MPLIYISHREGDAPELAEKIAAHLKVCFGDEEVVLGSQPPETQTSEAVRTAVADCQVLIVLVGPNWSRGTEPGSPGLRDPKDTVRQEVETGLEEGLLILPAILPDAERLIDIPLPQPMAGLLRHQGVSLDGENPAEGLSELARRLETGLALRNIVRNSSLKRGSIHHRALPEEDLLGFTPENRPQDVLGLEHSNLSETRRAIDYQETALNLAREQKDREGECQALGKLGLAFGKVGETHRAIECFEKQLPLLKELGHRDLLGGTLANLGDAWAVRGDFPRAISFYNQQLGLALELEDRDMEAASQVGLGHCHIKMEQTERGVKFYERALDHIRKAGEPAEQARLFIGLGLNYRKLDRPAEAVDLFKQALERVRRLGDRREEVLLLNDLAETYEELKEPDLALGFREQQLELARELDDAGLEGQILLALAEEHHRRGDLKKALALAHQARERVHLKDYVLHRRIRQKIQEWE